MIFEYAKHFLWLTIFAFYSCDEAKSTNEGKSEELLKQEEIAFISKTKKMSGEVQEKGELKLFPLEEASTFPKASLDLVTKLESQKAAKHKLQFSVEEFNLAEPTKDSRSENLANSKKGQHIHFILNNGPYQAHYEEEFEVDFHQGHNVILAFLSRSYHESVKEQSAFFFEDFVIGEVFEEFDKTQPCLIYSRPKGSYKLGEADRILVDFYLLNAELSEVGMKVELTIDDNLFMLPNWQPYWVEGLKAGEHNFRLRLLTKDGELVEGPFNDSGIRTIAIE